MNINFYIFSNVNSCKYYYVIPISQLCFSNYSILSDVRGENRHLGIFETTSFREVFIYLLNIVDYC